MTIRKQNYGNVYNIINYSLPKLHTGKKWFVDFLCYDPLEQKMRRKKYHLDGIKSVKERKAHAAELIANITKRLRDGWNVWANVEDSRQYTLFENICEVYRSFYEKQRRSGAIKEKTYLSWKSYFKVFTEWVKEREVSPVVYAYQIDKVLINDFLDYLYLDKDLSGRTRNNYRTWLYMLCGWMVDKGYIAVNPVEGIKSVREEVKMRDALPPRELERLREYLMERNRHFLLACMMEYYCFIRPEELSTIKIGDISVKRQSVRISAEAAKNRREAAVGLNDTVIKMMLALGVFEHGSEEYLFGTRQFTPSMTKQTGRIFREEFVKVRRALRWPKSYQFYSLKDSGIRDLANAEGIVVARDQARHSDVATTNKYLKGDALTVHEETKHFKGGL